MTTELQTKPETILIVDDDVRVVELLQIALGGRGYNVLAAHDGDRALRMVQRNRPDLLVCDVRLPRKSGFEVVDTIRRDAALRLLPIILISADAATESRLQGLKLGADDYMAKPFSPRELIIKIRRILDRSQDRNLLLLKNEMLEEEVRRSRDTLLQMREEVGQSLNRMGSVLTEVVEFSRSHSIETILERFIVTAVANLDFEQVALFTPDEEGTLAVRVRRGIPESVTRGLHLLPNGAVAHLCSSLRRPMRIEEFEGYPEARDEVLLLSSAGILLIVPAMTEFRLHALLGLGDRQCDRPLGRFDFKLLEVLGSSIVVALQNAESFQQTQRAFLDTTAGLIASIEERYAFLRGHSARVRLLSLAMGEALGLPGPQRESLGYGALLHDLGQLENYGTLLEKSVLLSPSDRQLHRRRSAENGAHLLGPGGAGAVGEIVRHHQEFWNGGGVPDGLRELEIPLGARIVALANAWDALRHDRPHRPAYSVEEAIRIIRERSGRQFDPNLVPLLVQVAGGFAGSVPARGDAQPLATEAGA